MREKGKYKNTPNWGSIWVRRKFLQKTISFGFVSKLLADRMQRILVSYMAYFIQIQIF